MQRGTPRESDTASRRELVEPVYLVAQLVTSQPVTVDTTVTFFSHSDVLGPSRNTRENSSHHPLCTAHMNTVCVVSHSPCWKCRVFTWKVVHKDKDGPCVDRTAQVAQTQSRVGESGTSTAGGRVEVRSTVSSGEEKHEAERVEVWAGAVWRHRSSVEPGSCVRAVGRVDGSLIPTRRPC